MKGSIRKGGVYLVSDRSLTMPPNDQRNFHPKRPVIVLSGDAKNEQTSWPLVYVVPTSTATTLKTEYCVKLAQGVGNLPSKCWIRTVCAQPFLKEELGDYLGQLPAQVVLLIEENLFAYMGLTD
ncbi:mRNA-degrading endonuclease, toxin component of the MazEF toxin-antitoxin module [Streptosporangium canum]|uniref:mRNA-degrading endonuclease, toxin component of the MazEF toxin-antitoxin module n=1 Tax=Streptosporangium canum TaxID=324952 RepID=A0A1I4ECF9_9ACTN|nr:type II toxin-antitoxin system PemK/MazF family toxin [Streptosporangium canum]SFL02889.1 mRNA-degrading endonuclease, toxin component of the MazEF toxin-antitoxin module [Streptosporangium canum]